MQQSICPGAKRLRGFFLILAIALASVFSLAQASNASLNGTYTMAMGSLNFYSVQYNLSGQEVGFCTGFVAQLPYGYSCVNQTGQDIITGTLIADGLGNITSSSTFSSTDDPNAYQCSSAYNAAPNCPYKVPAGTTWSSTTAYVVGDEVDYKPGTKLLTYQAVANNTGKTPSGTNVCTATTRPPKCDWDQLYVSASGNNSTQTGTLSGTYTIQSNGSGVMSVTVSGQTNAISYALLLSTLPSAVGQQVSIIAVPEVGIGNTGGGTAVRIK
jgi:hypothetical protein